jgi:prepilin-type N-terminal cleavage/methylation domain-containing protein
MIFTMPLCRRKVAARAFTKEDGFTLIELLIVVVIIGLLTAIGIATFTGQQNKAHDVEAKAAARTAQLAMETYRVEHKDYTGATVTELVALQPALQDAPSLAIQQATSNEFELSTSSIGTSPVTFTVTRNANGTIARTCTPANTGGCQSGGVW